MLGPARSRMISTWELPSLRSPDPFTWATGDWRCSLRRRCRDFALADPPRVRCVTWTVPA